MNLSTIEMERPKAREAFLDYRRAVREHAEAKLDEAQREYEEIDRAVMQGYKQLAAGRQLLRLSHTIAEGGTVDVEYHAGAKRMPALAVCRADARFCFCDGISAAGRVVYRADGLRRKADTVSIDRALESPPPELRGWGQFKAIVPTIPPPFRPPHKLSGYHLLWEAEWEPGVPPGDPALLRHLGGDLYAVLAVWDLTELERAVLAGRAVG